MSKFSQAIHNLYNKILPIAEKSGVELNLDYADPAALDIDIETDDPELKAQLETELKNAIARTNSGSVKLKIMKGKITISDTGTVLSHPLCEALSHGRVSVKSRVGFGTDINISLAKPTEDSKKVQDQKPARDAKPAPKQIAASKSTKASKATKAPKTTKPAKKH